MEHILGSQASLYVAVYCSLQFRLPGPLLALDYSKLMQQIEYSRQFVMENHFSDNHSDTYHRQHMLATYGQQHKHTRASHTTELFCKDTMTGASTGPHRAHFYTQ